MTAILEQNLPGLYVDSKVVTCGADKADVNRYGYKRTEVPIDRWFDCHQAGYLFVPGDMRSFYDKQYEQWRYTHAEALWHGTQWDVLDLDCESSPYFDPTDLEYIDPEVENLLYAVCESASSREDGKPVRLHGYWLTERAITERSDYTAFLYGLKSKLRTMTGAERHPAQPVYGVKRDRDFYELYENVITEKQARELIEIGYERYPNVRDMPTRRSDNYVPSRGRVEGVLGDNSNITDDSLREWLTGYGVRVYKGERVANGQNVYYLECPFQSEHTGSGSEDGATDAYLTLNSEGKWGFGCFHEHCQDRNWHDFKTAVTCPIRSTLRHLDIPLGRVEFSDDRLQRVYRDIPCKVCGEPGDFLFDGNRSIFFCADCPPQLISEYRRVCQ